MEHLGQIMGQVGYDKEVGLGNYSPLLGLQGSCDYAIGVPIDVPTKIVVCAHFPLLCIIRHLSYAQYDLVSFFLSSLTSTLYVYSK